MGLTEMHNRPPLPRKLPPAVHDALAPRAHLLDLLGLSGDHAHAHAVLCAAAAIIAHRPPSSTSSSYGPIIPPPLAATTIRPLPLPRLRNLQRHATSRPLMLLPWRSRPRELWLWADSAADVVGRSVSRAVLLLRLLLLLRCVLFYRTIPQALDAVLP